jgi:hypothetical protein
MTVICGRVVHFRSMFLLGFCLSVFPLVASIRLCGHNLKWKTIEWDTFTLPNQLLFFSCQRLSIC